MQALAKEKTGTGCDLPRSGLTTGEISDIVVRSNRQAAPQIRFSSPRRKGSDARQVQNLTTLLRYFMTVGFVKNYFAP